MSQADAKTLPAAATTMVVRTPHTAASAPPARAPSGWIREAAACNRQLKQKRAHSEVADGIENVQRTEYAKAKICAGPIARKGAQHRLRADESQPGDCFVKRSTRRRTFRPRLRLSDQRD